MGKATQDLRNEHDAILHVLEILDAMMANDKKEDTEMLQYYNEVVYFQKPSQINVIMAKKKIICLWIWKSTVSLMKADLSGLCFMIIIRAGNILL